MSEHLLVRVSGASQQICHSVEKYNIPVYISVHISVNTERFSECISNAFTGRQKVDVQQCKLDMPADLSAYMSSHSTQYRDIYYVHAIQ